MAHVNNQHLLLLLNTADLSLRYEICSRDLRFRWNLPATFPRVEAKVLKLMFSLQHSEMDVIVFVALGNLSVAIKGLSSSSIYKVQAELVAGIPKTKSFESLKLISVYRVHMYASGESCSCNHSSLEPY